jgi:hypothetical protein
MHNEQGFDGYGDYWQGVCEVQASHIELTHGGVLEANVM